MSLVVLSLALVVIALDRQGRSAIGDILQLLRKWTGACIPEQGLRDTMFTHGLHLDDIEKDLEVHVMFVQCLSPQHVLFK